MAYTSPDNIASVEDPSYFYKYPLTPEPLDENAFIKLTSFGYDNNLYGSSANIWTDPKKAEEKNKLLSDITNQLFLPIPMEGLNFNDSIDYENIKGGTFFHRQLNIFADTLRTYGPLAALEDYAKATAGGALNNFMATLFNGMTLREFTFSWDFIPYSKEDAATLKNIINSIRKAALPRYDNNSWAIKFPDFWIVEPYINGNLLYELNFLVLTDVSVSYDKGDGTTFFYDGSPVHTRLTLKFKEVYPAGSELVNR